MARAIKHIKAGLLHVEVIGTVPESAPGRRRSGRCRPTSAAQQFYNEYGDDFKFEVTQVISLSNGDEVSKEFRPYKQMIERVNRTYKASYRPTNGFDSYDGANYDLALRVAYYNFLRPHKHTRFDVLNKVDALENADTMPGKWQLLIFPGQQTILNLQKQPAA